jgi:hypothetical protein
MIQYLIQRRVERRISGVLEDKEKKGEQLNRRKVL